MIFKQISVATSGEKNNSIVLYALTDEGQLYVGTTMINKPEKMEWRVVENPKSNHQPLSQGEVDKVVAQNKIAEEKYRI